MWTCQTTFIAFQPTTLRQKPHTTHTTLRQELVHPKDPMPSLKKPNLVYCIPCVMCPVMYIGQTSRPLETQLKEHKDAVKHAKTEVSAVVEHVWKGNHQVDFQQTFDLAHHNA